MSVVVADATEFDVFILGLNFVNCFAPIRYLAIVNRPVDQFAFSSSSLRDFVSIFIRTGHCFRYFVFRNALDDNIITGCLYVLYKEDLISLDFYAILTV